MLTVDNILGNSLEDIYLLQEGEIENSTWLERVVLKFGSAFIVVSVNSDTDEVETDIRDRFDADSSFAEISRRPDSSLFSLLGGKLSWVWTMTNNQGYTDGMQFQFDSKTKRTIQFIAIASRLEINILCSVPVKG